MATGGTDDHVTLKEFFLTVLADRQAAIEQRFISFDKDVSTQRRAVDVALEASNAAIEAALASAKEATSKAETYNEKRFQSVNEFRQQLADQAATFARKAEMDIALKGMQEKIDALQAQRQDDTGRRSGISATWVVVLSVVPIVLTGIGLIIAVLMGKTQ